MASCSHFPSVCSQFNNQIIEYAKVFIDCHVSSESVRSDKLQKILIMHVLNAWHLYRFFECMAFTEDTYACFECMAFVQVFNVIILQQGCCSYLADSIYESLWVMRYSRNRFCSQKTILARIAADDACALLYLNFTLDNYLQ